MMKNKLLKLSAILGGTAAISPIAMTISCGEAKKTIEVDTGEFDKTIKIAASWFNPGWEVKGANGKTPKQMFEESLTQKFAELQKNDEKFKDSGKVTFEAVEAKDTTEDDMKAGKDDIDLSVFAYHDFVGQFDKDNLDQQVDNFELPLVAQTSTLKFTWGADDNDTYIDGSDSDPLRKAAERENNIQFEQAWGEYPEWNQKSNTHSQDLKWDGSKYAVFYDDNKTTYVYHGAILIAGDKAKRDSIIADWEAKDWDKFVKHGIIYKKKTKGGGYKYPTALLARHFGKSLKEIRQELEDTTNKNVLTAKSASEALGKDQSGKTYHIAFDDEGSFNWTASKPSSAPFKPTGYQPTNDVRVRVLTLTDRAPYDAVFARKGISSHELSLISKALQQLTIQENQFGIFTGYNKFNALDKDLFKTLIKVQISAETNEIDPKTLTIPKIK